jgi:hypothetical protein
MEKKIISYLEKHVPNFKINRRGHTHMFTCPDCHAPEACRFVPGANKINCMKCNLSEDLVGLAKLLGHATHNDTDDSINDRLCIDLSFENTRITDEILSFYEKSGFDLTPIKKESKIPFELDWLNVEHKRRSDWETWLGTGLNLGVKTGKRSGITIVDIDQADIPADVDLLKGSPLIQKTGRGWHLIYKYVDIPTTKIDEYKIDILNDGKQAILMPSVIVDEKGTRNSREYTTPLALTDMPADLLKFLKSKLGNNGTKVSDPDEIVLDETSSLNLIGDGGRNSTLIQLGGILRKELNSSQTNYAINVLNKKLCSPPLSPKDIMNVTRMIDRYIKTDEKDLATQILKYLHIVEFANSREIKDALGFQKEEIDKALAYLVKELKLIKRGRNFSVIKRAEWKTTLNMTANSVEFRMPYFGKYANLCYGDNVLLGSATKNGKTTIAMNIIKDLSDQIKSMGINRKIYYITSEAGSRFMKTAGALGLVEGDFEWDFVSDPTKINLEDNSITILDWLMIEDKSATDSVMKYFVDQLWKSQGFLITFMQLKEDKEANWFAPNMVKQFPALAARYVYTDDGKGVEGQWHMDAIRDPKSHVKSGIIPCKYDYTSKRLIEL